MWSIFTSNTPCDAVISSTLPAYSFSPFLRPTISKFKSSLGILPIVKPYKFANFLTNSKILYEILWEIKDQLGFDPIFKTSFNDYRKFDGDFKNIIFLILNNFKIDEKASFFDQTLRIEKLPIKILTLVEKINIFFLKINYKSQSSVFIKDYNFNINSRIISKNNKVLKLTEKEVLVLLFLFNASKPKNISDLQKEVWKQKSTLETHTVETHIYRLRKKFSDVFDDRSFILSEKSGYSI